MFKENVPSNGPSQGEDLRDRFRDLVAEGNNHAHSSLSWLQRFRQKYTPPPSDDQNVTIGFANSQNTGE